MNILKQLEQLDRKFKSIFNDPILHRSLLYTFVIGLVAHGYAFLNLSICGDSLVEFYMHPGIIRHKIALGRFLVPVYSMLTCGKIILPWTLGLTSLLWIGLSVYLINSIFSITNKWSIFAVAGVMTVNQCLISLFSTYIHDSGADTFSLFCSVLAFYYLVKASTIQSWRKAMLGVCFLFTSLALYQAYISVTLILLIVYLIQCILTQNITISTIIHKGAWWSFLMAISGGLYFLCSKGIMAITGSTCHIDRYNSIDHIGTIFERFRPSLTEAYTNFLVTFFHPNSSIWPMPIILTLNIAIMVLTIWGFICIIRDTNRLNLPQYIYIFILIISIPFFANIAHFLSGSSHDLMHYAFYIQLIIPVLIANHYESPSRLFFGGIGRILIYSVIAVITFSNIQTANAVYIKKDFEREHGLFEMTKLISDIEHTEGYQYGRTSIGFAGKIPGYCVPGTDRICTIHGDEMDTPMCYYATIRDYCQTFLQYNINLCDNHILERIMKTDEFLQRPNYPDPGSIFYYDSILVVKLNQQENIW